MAKASAELRLARAQLREEKKRATWERVKHVLDKGADIIGALVRNPIFGAMAGYATVHYVGNLKKPNGQYYMHEAVVRALKGVCAAYPVYAATRGGTAGVIAASGIAAAVGIAADRPDVERSSYTPYYNPDTNLPPSIFTDPELSYYGIPMVPGG